MIDSKGSFAKLELSLVNVRGIESYGADSTRICGWDGPGTTLPILVERLVLDGGLGSNSHQGLTKRESRRLGGWSWRHARSVTIEKNSCHYLETVFFANNMRDCEYRVSRSQLLLSGSALPKCCSANVVAVKLATWRRDPPHSLSVPHNAYFL